MYTCTCAYIFDINIISTIDVAKGLTKLKQAIGIEHRKVWSIPDKHLKQQLFTRCQMTTVVVVVTAAASAAAAGA